MFEDLIESWQQLGNMLNDVQENYEDMHPDDVIGVLSNASMKVAELTLMIVRRREYIQQLRPYWKVTQSGRDAGMPPGPRGVPPVTGEGREVS